MSKRTETLGFAARAERAWHMMFPVPFCFMGMGIFRVWTETLYANHQMEFPALDLPVAIPLIDGYSCFDIVAALFLIAMAIFAKRLAPLYKKPWAIFLTAFSMVASACVNFVSILAPEAAPALFWPSEILGGMGIALILMLWSEFFGCINPLRVALYYSASIAVSCIVLWVFKGLSFYWLWVGACVIPLVSLLCLWRSYATLPQDAYPPAYQGDFSFPWKPVAVIGAYTFVYGMRGRLFAGPLAMNSGVGAFLGALGVYALICYVHRKETGSEGFGAEEAESGQFDFSLLYKVGVPLMLLSLIPIDLVLPWWQFVADSCALASYTILLVLIMAILANLSYRYGVCAIWIFAIERAVRLLASQAGRTVGQLVQMPGFNIALYILVLLVMAGLLAFVAIMFFSEQSISSSQWGVVLKLDPEAESAAAESTRLGIKVRELGRQAGLTPREEEVLLLVAQKRTLGQISRELVIGTNTVKTHTKHVYQKLGAHSREEVLELLGVREAE